MDTPQHVSVSISPQNQGVGILPRFLEAYSGMDYRSAPFQSPNTHAEYLIHFSGEGNDEAVHIAFQQAKNWILEQEAGK
jgi:hypothetical protein